MLNGGSFVSQCDGIINFDCENGTLISEGPCIFLGLRNAVKVYYLFSLNKIYTYIYIVVS